MTGEVSDSTAATEIYSAPSGQFIDEALMEYSSREYHKHKDLLWICQHLILIHIMHNSQHLHHGLLSINIL